MKPFANVELVEVPTLTQQQRFMFPKTENLRGKKITGIMTYSVDALTKTLLGQRPLAPNAALYQSYLTLYILGNPTTKKPAGEYVVIPLINLTPQSNNGMIREFVGFEIDIEKCHIDIPNASVIDVTTSYLLSFIYED